MAKYQQAAVTAVRLLKNNPLMHPRVAWQESTASMFGNGSSQQRKGCPREAFLSLCEEGLVRGAAPGVYTRSKKNKRYALKAVRILTDKPWLVSDTMALWKEVIGKKKKTHNNQMDVVIGLWNDGSLRHEKLITGQRRA